MTYLLDTNAWVAHLRQKNPGLTQRLLQETPGNIALCSMVLAELYYGAVRSGPRHEAANRAAIANLRQQFVSLSFDDAAVEDTLRCAHGFNGASRHGFSLSPRER